MYTCTALFHQFMCMYVDKLVNVLHKNGKICMSYKEHNRAISLKTKHVPMFIINSL